MLTKDSVLFYWDAALKGALPIVGGDPVFTRDGSGYFIDSEGKLRKAIVNRPRFEWVDLNDGFGKRPAVLLELGRTNKMPRSYEYGSWNPVFVSITTGQPDAFSGTNGSRINATTAGGHIYLSTSLTGDGTKVCFVIAKYDGASTSRFGLYDGTAAVFRHLVDVTWSASGVPTMTTSQGAGTLFPVVALGSGWYLLPVSASGVLAANVNQMYVYPAQNNTGSMLLCHAQVEDAAFYTAPIITSGATAARPVDVFYWKNPPKPQAMAFYLRMRVGVANPGPLEPILNFGGTARQLLLYHASNNLDLFHYDGVSSVFARIAYVPTLADLIEVVGVLNGNGSLLEILSVNGGAPTQSALSAALALGADWSDNKLHLNHYPNNSSYQAGRYADLKVVKLADITNQPGVATPAAVMSELRNFKLNAAGLVI